MAKLSSSAWVHTRNTSPCVPSPRKSPDGSRTILPHVRSSFPRYSGGQSIAVCWRPRHGPVTPYYFQDEVQNAVDWLNYLETTYPAERENALLLVGVTNPLATQRLLQLTHPLFTGVRVPDPRYWIPRSSY